MVVNYSRDCGSRFLDFDFDFDVDSDAADGGGGVLEGLFKFVNAQDVPVMIILSLLTVSMWSIAIFSNYYFNPNESAGLAMAFLGGNFFGSALLVKAVTQPLRPFFRSLKNDGEKQQPLIGMTGSVKSRVLDSTFGQVEVPREKGAPALLNAILPEDRGSLVRGDQILVIDFDDESNKYLVHPIPQSGNK